MTTPYEIKLYRYTPEVQKASEISRIDSLFTKIENRYWAWKKKKQESGIKEFTSRQIMSKEDAEAFFVGQRESDQKALIRIFEELNAHYIRLFCYVQEFNNTKIRVAIANDKNQYKRFCTGLKTANRIAIKYEDKRISNIAIWYGKKHCSTLSGIVNEYILNGITNRLPLLPYNSILITVFSGEEHFEEIRGIIQEETSKHHFADRKRNTPKSDLQPLSERCSDLYSDIMKQREWIFNKRTTSGGDSAQAGKMIIELLGLKFSTEKGLNKETTFINALHQIHYLEAHSLSDIIEIDFE